MNDIFFEFYFFTLTLKKICLLGSHSEKLRSLSTKVVCNNIHPNQRVHHTNYKIPNPCGGPMGFCAISKQSESPSCISMGSKELPADNLLLSIDSASTTHSVLRSKLSISAFASRPYLHLSTDQLCDVCNTAQIEHADHLFVDYEPLRPINLCAGAAPPQRFYRTFWRGLAGRLMKLKSIKRRLTAEEMVYKIKISTQGSKNQPDVEGYCTVTLDITC